METQELINYLDELLISQTGKHLDNLQLSILKGVLNGQKYADIAEEYHCTNGHAKDKAYELWKILSQVLGEDINKSNFKATIERLGFANTQHQIVGNPIQIGKINLCANSTKNNKKDLDIKIKIKAIKKLRDLGLTNEQIAEALEISIEQIDNVIK